jgi:hypothetical protein
MARFGIDLFALCDREPTHCIPTQNVRKVAIHKSRKEVARSGGCQKQRDYAMKNAQIYDVVCKNEN